MALIDATKKQAETEEQFALRIRMLARNKLLEKAAPISQDALAAARELSELPYHGNLSSNRPSFDD